MNAKWPQPPLNHDLFMKFSITKLQLGCLMSSKTERIPSLSSWIDAGLLASSISHEFKERSYKVSDYKISLDNCDHLFQRFGNFYHKRSMISLLMWFRSKVSNFGVMTFVQFVIPNYDEKWTNNTFEHISNIFASSDNRSSEDFHEEIELPTFCGLQNSKNWPTKSNQEHCTECSNSSSGSSSEEAREV